MAISNVYVAVLYVVLGFKDQVDSRSGIYLFIYLFAYLLPCMKVVFLTLSTSVYVLFKYRYRGFTSVCFI